MGSGPQHLLILHLVSKSLQMACTLWSQTTPEIRCERLLYLQGRFQPLSARIRVPLMGLGPMFECLVSQQSPLVQINPLLSLSTMATPK
jgi:hypothetical protein